MRANGAVGRAAMSGRVQSHAAWALTRRRTVVGSSPDPAVPSVVAYFGEVRALPFDPRTIGFGPRDSVGRGSRRLDARAQAHARRCAERKLVQTTYGGRHDTVAMGERDGGGVAPRQGNRRRNQITTALVRSTCSQNMRQGGARIGVPAGAEEPASGLGNVLSSRRWLARLSA
jgi:hypothetical protein